MPEDTKSEQELEQEIEAQLKGETTAVPTENDGGSKAETLETRVNKEAAM